MSDPIPSFVLSSLLPVPHGFATRAGGVSEGAYASLNLGFSVGDLRERVEENHRRLAAAAGAALDALHTVKQVHGDRVVEAGAGEGTGALRLPEGEADALWTERPEHWVAVGTADCVPVLLVDPEGRRVAAVHSGWRGTDAHIVARAVEALVAKGSQPERLLAAVGPCIQRCCYVVSEDLGERFTTRFGPEVVVRERGDVRLDLSRAVRDTLRGAGLKAAHVEVLPHCTACDASRFFSHRRDAGRTGRHLNFVVNRF
ncbi:peptidoglycan editing factor PgeF [Vitiosangium sp. GDMCC 1.1324]|uniref:peptidoglycan editing factor PgeF n=1 Tax=Vitiosangium sp. (strain GDMCC 1.1324) TaxID=2138576 RepID=UPI000D37374B|nr:peptidoglycan editing factor PgeF [Vitiosangium sp. GDMCC 1.1324]PTL78279.1 peptidoglycan editing factor PgeF [Vitiosangium sp. GDMCC 1.1324]